MRILVINQYFPPDAAATAHMIGELTHDLTREHEVWVVAGQPSYNPEVGAAPPPRARVVRARSTTFARRSIAGRIVNYGTFTISAAVRTCLTPRPDVVVAMTDPPTIGLVGVIGALRHRCPLVQIYQDVFPDIAIAMGRIRSPIILRAWSWLNGVVRRRAVRLIVVGRDIQEKLERAGVPRQKICFVPGWANPQVVDSEAARRMRTEKDWDESFVVMHAGNMGLAQNLDVVLEAAELLRNQRDILLVFLGDGAAKDPLVREVRGRRLSNVAFLPYHPRAEAQSLMAAADAHIVSLVPGLWGCAAPSKTYGVMAAGRPFIAAVDEGSEPARIIEEFGCGHWVPAGDAEGLAGAILDLKRQGAVGMGRRGLNAFRVRYTRELGTASVAAILQNAVERTRSDPRMLAAR